MTSLSVGVMVYNEERYIDGILRAMVEQKLDKFKIEEIIVISSGSTDKTNDIVKQNAKQNPKIKLIIQKNREGKYSAINLFLKTARSDILVLASGDILPLKDCVERLCLPLLNPRMGVCGTHSIPKNDTSKFSGYIAQFEWQLVHKISLEKPKFGEMIAFRKIFDKLLPTAVDEEEIVRIIKSKGYKGVYVPNAVVFNHSPEKIRNIIIQRRRIYAGHLELKQERGYGVPTLSNINILRYLFRISHKKPLWSIGAVFVEGYARILGLMDYIFGKNHVIWEKKNEPPRPKGTGYHRY